jgi:hypothetical protein
MFQMICIVFALSDYIDDSMISCFVKLACPKLRLKSINRFKLIGYIMYVVCIV